MKKIKIIKVRYSRRLVLGLFLAVFLSTSFLSTFPPQTVSAAIPSEARAKSRAEAYCDTRRYDKKAAKGADSEHAACVQGYMTSIRGELVDARSVCVEGTGGLFRTTPLSDSALACQVGFNQGFREFIKDNPPNISAKEAASRATAYCKTRDEFKPSKQNFSPGEYDACEKGYAASIQGKSNWATVCSSSYKNNVEFNACETGRVQGIKEYQKDHGGKASSSTVKPVDNTSDAADAADAATNSTAADSDDAPDVSCGDPFDLSWMVCPIIKGMIAATGSLDNFINSQMSIGSEGATSDPNQIFCNSDSAGTARKSCKAYYEAWSTMRNLALGLMVAAGILILIAQAVGMEILDAYTIRKVLPGFLTAALGITLSWQLMQFFVQFANDLAFGVRFLIYQPFTGFDDTTLGGGAVAVGTLLSYGALTLLGWVGLLSFVATALLAVFIAVLVLILRDIVITMAIIIAPVAIVMYILPNTKKLYKFWWSTFSKALLMFAIISAMIATGRVFAAISSTRSDNPVAQLAGFSGYFLPYALAGYSLKFADPFTRMGGEGLTGKAKGMFGGISQFRGNRRKARLERARAGTLYREDFGKFTNPFTGKKTSVGKIGSRAAMEFTDQDELAPYRLGKAGIWGFKRGRYVMESQILDKKMEHNMAAFQALQKTGGIHYSTARAMTGSLDHFTRDMDADSVQALAEKFGTKNAAGEWDGGWRAPQGTMDLVTMADIMEKSGTSKGMLAAQELKADAGTMGSLRGGEMHRADFQTVGLYAAAAQGRTEVEDLTRIYNTVAREKDPHEAMRIVGQAQDLSKAQRPSQRRGHGIQFRKGADGQIEAYSAYENPNSKEAIGSVMSMHPNELSSAKSEDVDAIAHTIQATGSKTKMVLQNGQLVDTGVAKTGVELEQAIAMRQKLLQISGPYGYSDPDGARKLKRIEESLGISPEERNAFQRGFDPNDPALHGQQPEPGPEPPPNG